jgi:hypothetical protein
MYKKPVNNVNPNITIQKLKIFELHLGAIYKTENQKQTKMNNQNYFFVIAFITYQKLSNHLTPPSQILKVQKACILNRYSYINQIKKAIIIIL